MTIGQPRGAPNLPAVLARPTGAVDAADALDLIDGLEHSITSGGRSLSRDVIALSIRAQLLLRAGLAVRALIIDALAHTYRRITLGGQMVVLELGIYH